MKDILDLNSASLQELMKVVTDIVEQRKNYYSI